MEARDRVPHEHEYLLLDKTKLTTLSTQLTMTKYDRLQYSNFILSEFYLQL